MNEFVEGSRSNSSCAKVDIVVDTYMLKAGVGNFKDYTKNKISTQNTLEEECDIGVILT